MPILVKDYTFKDTGKNVYLSVGLRNVYPSKVVIYSNSTYVKANYPPYFFELDVAFDIDPLKSSASIDASLGLIIFVLVKTDESIQWNQAHYTGQDRLERRHQGEKRQLELEQELKKKRLQETREKERELVRAQIQVERDARAAVQQLKEKEIQTAKDHIVSWSKEMAAKKSTQVPLNDNVRTDSAIFTEESCSSPTLNNLNQDLQSMKIETLEDDDEESDEDVDLDAIRSAIQKQLQGPQHAPPRRSGKAPAQKISLTFTGRGSIPTHTARETEDAKWLSRIKLAKAMHAMKGGEASLANQETNNNLQSAKEKGASFFRLGNYEGALNAFSEAITMDSQDIAAISNRAACYLKLESHHKCILDCNTGLATISREEDIIKTEIKKDDGNNDTRRRQKVKLYIRRGTAYASLTGLENTRVAINDYQSALELDPENETIARDLKELLILAGQDSNNELVSATPAAAPFVSVQ